MAEDREREEGRITEEMVPPALTPVTIVEMGELADKERRTVHLSSGFLLSRLGASCFDDILIEHGAKPRRTGLLCPLCGKGGIELISVEAIYREEGRSGRRPQDHVGGKYLYECKEPICGARFWGDHFWEDISGRRKR